MTKVTLENGTNKQSKNTSETASISHLNMSAFSLVLFAKSSFLPCFKQ